MYHRDFWKGGGVRERGRNLPTEDWGITGAWDRCGAGRFREALGWDPGPLFTCDSDRSHWQESY